MRFVGLLLKILVTLVVGMGVLYFAWDYGRLAFAGYALKNDFGRTSRLAFMTTDEYKQSCYKAIRDSGSVYKQDIRVEDAIVGFQLRFVSSVDYTIEVICAGVGITPLEITKKQLLSGIQKISGSGGMVVTNNRGELVVKDAQVVLANSVHRLGVGFNAGAPTLNWKGLTGGIIQEFDGAPATTCEGYSGACCNDPYEVGSGSALLKSTNCPNRCYTTCRSRPSLVYFNANPLIDQVSREVAIVRGQIIAFGYEISSIGSELSNMRIAFGDGHEAKLLKSRDVIERIYTCAMDSCIYEARIYAWDDSGVAQLDTPINKITVIVR